MKLNHVGISVSDIERSIRFYCDTFGMEQFCEIMPVGGPAHEAMMDLPGVSGRMCVVGKGPMHLELFEFHQPAPAVRGAYPVSDHGVSHFGIEVEDIDATYRAVEAAGVRIHAPVIRFGSSMRATYCRDPDGNVFEIMQPGG